MEVSLQAVHESEEEGYFSIDSEKVLISLEKKRRHLLEDPEESWHHKSHSIWLESGNEKQIKN